MNRVRIAILFFAFAVNAIAADIKISIECESKGTALTGEKLAGFKEKFVFEEKSVEDAKFADYKILKREFFSNGKEYKNIGADSTNEYLLFRASSTIGSGFNRRLNVFTFYIDLKSLELERIVTTIPKTEEERSRSICKLIKS